MTTHFARRQGTIRSFVLVAMWLLAAGILVLASRLPWLASGPGPPPDSFRVFTAADVPETALGISGGVGPASGVDPATRTYHSTMHIILDDIDAYARGLTAIKVSESTHGTVELVRALLGHTASRAASLQVLDLDQIERRVTRQLG